MLAPNENKMRILAIVIIFLTTACGKKNSQGFMDNCQKTEFWELKDLTNERIKFKVKFPVDWQTKEDFVKGDTISITTMDTVEFLKTGYFRILSVTQYGTSIGMEANFDVIKDSVKPFYESGRVTINKNEGLYILQEQVWGQDTLTTANILFQKRDYVVNVITRMTKGKDDRVKICDYKQILNTLTME